MTPTSSPAGAPTISGPIVASTTSDLGVSVVFEGTDLTTGSSLVLAISGAVNTSLYTNSSDFVQEWSPTRVVLKNLPVGAIRSTFAITSAAGSTGAKPVAYTYEWFNPDNQTAASPPLAIAVGDSEIWFSREWAGWGERLGFDQIASSLATWVPNPPAVFAMKNTNSDMSVATSLANEDVRVDEAGSAWFSQSGHYLFEYDVPNHSRLVRHDSSISAPKVYPIPGDNNQTVGMAFDTGRNHRRVWFEMQARSSDANTAELFPSKLVSFHPREGSETVGIPSTTADFSFATSGTCVAGLCSNDHSLNCTTNTDCTLTCSIDNHCSNAYSKACKTATDCVLARQVCPQGTACDTEAGDADLNTFHEYALPSGTLRVGHILVDDTPGSRAVWYTRYWSGEEVSKIGRLDPTQPSVPGVNPVEYPLAGPAYPLFGARPWFIAKAPDGNVVFTEEVSGRLSRFRVSELSNPNVDCEILTGGINQCIDQVTVPHDPTSQALHSVAFDDDGNAWFTLWNFAENTYGENRPLGYMTPDWSSFVMLPPLSVFPCPGLPINCTSFLDNDGVGAAGIANDPATGDMWFADFNKIRLGRLRDASSAVSASWYVTTGSDDAWEDASPTNNPSKPKTTANLLKLEKSSNGLEHATMAAFRVTSQGGVNGRALASRLTIPITSPLQTRSVKLRFFVGIPNDAAWNVNANGDIKTRTKLASIDVTRTLATSTTEISVDVSRLLDAARGHPNWHTGMTNVVPFYVARYDTTPFSLSLRAFEFISTPANPAIQVADVRTPN